MPRSSAGELNVTEEQWTKTRRIVDHALDLVGEERAKYVEEACEGDPVVLKEVNSLLAVEEESKEFIETPLLPRSSNSEDLLPKQIGPYRILRELGRGGMAYVYEAVRDDIELRVALKVIKPQVLDREELSWRFRHERRILASLEHPNIARLFDGGSTEDGLPYFAMEYVEGERLDEYCKDAQLNVADRVVLFRKICNAVQYAHRKLVVHRDLKPGNILVTKDGEPKLLDFGIAKLLEPEPGTVGQTTLPATVPGIQPMTPGYASPEQFKGETITVATDVYSLGVVLYEVLTGQNPHRLSEPVFEQYRKAAVEDPPLRPSDAVSSFHMSGTTAETTVPLGGSPSEAPKVDRRALSRELSGDLDCILIRALRKKPENRYDSVASFDDDLRRFLRGRPVRARRGDAIYRVSKFVGRNRVAVTLTLSAVVLLISLLFFHRHMQEQNERIIQENERILQERVKGVLSIFHGDMDEEKLQAELEKIREDAEDWAAVLTDINDLAREREEETGNHRAAEKVFRAITEIELEPTEESLSITDIARNNLAASLQAQGKLGEAEDHYQTSFEYRKMAPGMDPRDVVITLQNIATLYQDMGELNQAEDYLFQAIELADRVFEEGHDTRLAIRNNLGFQLKKQGDLERAEEVFLELLDLAPEERRPGVLAHLATIDLALGRPGEAEKKSREAYELAYRNLGHWQVAELESIWAESLQALGKAETIEEKLTRTEALLRAKLGPESRRAVEARKRLEAL